MDLTVIGGLAFLAFNSLVMLDEARIMRNRKSAVEYDTMLNLAIVLALIVYALSH
mgnify:CR=1 FL=1